MPIIGGRQAAEEALSRIQPEAYGRTRNFLDGAVTRLSPYLRHGVLTLAEVRDRAGRHGKFLSELGWRDYWQRLYFLLGNGVWDDLEPWKTGLPSEAYSTVLPDDLLHAATGLRCMDSFSRELTDTGYLHNHSRMWLAAYIVHWRRSRWQAGATWFLEHLLDGDPASNNLSWQWVASTFSHKPYFFNRENLEHYSRGIFCSDCSSRNNCPFDGTYGELAEKLFTVAAPAGKARELRESPRPAISLPAEGTPLVWIHNDSLNPKSTVVQSNPGAAAIYVTDKQELDRKRATFIEQCLAEMSATMERRQGEPVAELMGAAKRHGADHILTMETPDPLLRATADKLRQHHLPVYWIAPPPFVENSRPYNLSRFSRYWKDANPTF